MTQEGPVVTLSGRTWLSDSCAGFLDSEPARHLPHRAFLACLLVCSACLTPLSARMTARVGPCTPIVAGLLFLLAGGRRREGEKYAGLRILR
jgi:hypothetical protein